MDEVQHSYFQTLVVRTIIGELNLSEAESASFSDWVYSFFKEVVLAEQELATDMYKNYSLVDIDEVHGYIEWRANLLLQNFGLTKIFKTKTNPMIWMNAFDPENINNTRTDFFETRVVNYSKVTEDKNAWSDL